jgi:hypothetical protein
MKFIEEGYDIYRGRLKDPSLKKLNWYEENIVKHLPTTDDFILKIKIGDEHLIDILKEKNDLEYLNNENVHGRNIL